jgi:hypothetical protein
MRCQLPPLNPATWSASKRLALGRLGLGLKTGISTLVLLHESGQVIQSDHQQPRAMAGPHQYGARLLAAAIRQGLIEERVGVQALDALDFPPNVHAVTDDVGIFVPTETVRVLGDSATVDTDPRQYLAGFQFAPLTFLAARS